jgi:acetyl-CoA carboxylase biotin carboxylase subunit
MMKRIRRLLIANRGEIASRILRTCHAMGIDTVAVFSDADRHAPFVEEADFAVRLGPAPSASSYLNIPAILAAARDSGADAVHPGYGFLAENGDFAAACLAAGLTFVGPRPEVIRVLGSKSESRRLVAAAGVPVVPGYDGTDQRSETLLARASEIGFPVLLKASAGGGGKGMRVVASAGELAAALDSARREAQRAFGDDTMLLERYIERPRHIEFQILGDLHGNLVHLCERECSIQRRHQKIIEESPAPLMTAELRRRMGEAALAVGRAVQYQNAGTVEFILSPGGEFYFLEVNTRLQVEHPVTECVLGLDLVREQIRVAQGERLEFEAAPVQRGAAIECRLYAEDPDNGFLPTTGVLLDWHPRSVPPGLRIDSGVRAGSEVGIHYDPMLAKIICHAPTRAEAVQQLTRALRDLSVHGVTTNRDFLVRVLEHPAFASGELDTHFLERHAGALRPRQPSPAALSRAAVAATLAGAVQRARTREILPALRPGFRNNPGPATTVRYGSVAGELEVSYRALASDRYQIAAAALDGAVCDLRLDGAELAFCDERGQRWRFRVITSGMVHHVQSRDGTIVLSEIPRFPEVAAEQVTGGCTAPMPGRVVRVLVAAGQSVGAGETLLILEAMKMEHPVRAPRDGLVEKVWVGEGEQVESDQLLVVLAEPGD